MEMSVETADLFLGAVLLAHGGRLAGLSVSNGSGRRRRVSFRIGGSDLDRVVDQYRGGTATVNATRLKHELNHLKDLLFEELRRDR